MQQLEAHDALIPDETNKETFTVVNRSKKKQAKKTSPVKSGYATRGKGSLSKPFR